MKRRCRHYSAIRHQGPADPGSKLCWSVMKIDKELRQVVSKYNLSDTAQDAKEITYIMKQDTDFK